MSEKRRGSYAKGIAKREEILERALDVIAEEGYAGASVRAIADAAGLSQAGLLHYFESKEELFTEILRKRDDVDAAIFGDIDPAHATAQDIHDRYVAVVRHNADVPGLVHLFSRVAADAADPAHPAHEYFLARGAALRTVYRDGVVRAQRDGTVTSDIDADTLARLFQAIADGMQLQWMLDPSVDMAAVVDAFFVLMQAGRGAAASPT